ncbi:hypothetical protein OKE80_07420 [Riemerella anatipestifer]|uniref:Uncharacterized protein n=2 Tax=Riemerella anatipestifer TaxID=34085 RepID=E4TCP7_RIEAD|nr:hypothetical protein [Riemerella anatipestifer]ADQ82556.1 hypothetical protein Riean_1399 [Riemerella anatipestifer ATCC 11845 = DSM 15868]ADZ11951.1 hypothetical protein RIA_0812 [Riemerella anatipestifer RA-GD]AFD56566.1 hypothetical protein RA0C_1679 [Riemerella anatipestifer ATCC 11845 = DSM 15868]AZZ58542.1 hypothetical protein AWB57_05530 [Riemerella anatipestifer]MCE4247675.1 hypothetical protein [Riemerella anatipestifer]
MKKLFFVATLLVAGVMSAKVGTPNRKCIKDDARKSIEYLPIKKLGGVEKVNIPSFITAGACSNWITVDASCGARYYLCSDHYENMEELMDDVDYFDDAKCN